MSEQKDTKKFKMGFHIFITLFALGIIISSISGYGEMERATMYLILGVLIGGSSLFQFFKTVR
ncbi:hypothetical protein J2S78_000524 [Salibacterium salarium]|uniref:hypothetical protein n=1 Tax=Salibacterium salarium TaxID=284579 RepID=UPI0027819AC7|nr:hypothetical protein [Salibacterium salarium]MDQ0298116.1 hypothetical protein [Salibacterium salarium]